MSAPHRVIPNEAGRYDVISGRTGKTYHVVPSADPNAAPGGATCSCEWGSRAAVVRNVPCSHVKAVHAFAILAARKRAVVRNIKDADPEYSPDPVDMPGYVMPEPRPGEDDGQDEPGWLVDGELPHGPAPTTPTDNAARAFRRAAARD